MQAFEFCRNDVAPRFSDWAVACHDLNAKKQQELFAVLSFASRVADIPHRASDVAVATTQIQWWQRQLASIGAQIDDDTRYRELGAESITLHPSLVAMRPLLTRSPDAITSLQRLLEHASADVEFSGFATEHELHHFWQLRSEALWTLLLSVFEQDYSEHWAAMTALVEWSQLLKQWPRYALDGIIYFPEEWLSSHQLSAQQLTEKHQSLALQKLLAERSSDYRLKAQQAIAAIPVADRIVVSPLLRWLHLQNAWLKKTERAGYPLYDFRIELGWLQKRWCCWRAHHRTL